jgi:hypothetical protein
MSAELFDVLSWKDTNAPLQLYRWFLNALTGTLGATLRRLPDALDPRGRSLLEAIQALPDSSFFRILVAPEIYHSVLFEIDKRPEDVASLFSAAMSAERRRLGVEPNGLSPVWSALGDLYWPAGFDVLPEGRSFRFEPDRPFIAPRIGNFLPVDAFSPYARAPFAPGLGEPADFTESELRSVVERLDEAIDLIRTVSPNALGLVMLYAKQLVLRKSVLAEADFGSLSLDEYIGRLTIINPHLERWNRFQLAESIVHESMHSFLYAAELRGLCLVRREDPPSVQVKSPWSGASLDFHSFVHACLVWFGLFYFWRKAELCPDLPQDVVRGFCAETAKGFLGERLTCSEAARKRMWPDITVLIDRMQDSVRKAVLQKQVVIQNL